MKKRVWCLLLAIGLLMGLILFGAARVYVVDFAPEAFTQSDKKLDNPDRGFYRIQGYTIKTEPQQFQQKGNQAGQDRVLELVQINLKHFRSGQITQTGLENVERLFSFLEEKPLRYIVRFVYDWDGNAAATEPESIDVILNHMRQLSPILKAHADSIFLVQGLFIGNWGEMNGTAYASRENVTRLAAELAADTAEETFLAVRTPAYWRKIIGGEQPEESDPLAARLGLYNDGILGNSGDCGTYVGKAEDRADPFTSWNRADELAFQEALCQRVPNGGEVVLDNPLNDFENALQTFRTMHITYLNWDYDRAVLDKWAAVTVAEPPYEGMDGLTYMERHLGYRYWIESAFCGYFPLSGRLHVGANLKNEGFAPLYTANQLTLTLVGREERLRIPLSADLRKLPGGNQREQTLAAQADIPLTALLETDYDVYLEIQAGSQPLALANEQEPGEYGFYLGRFCVRRPDWFRAVFGSKALRLYEFALPDSAL